MYKVYYYASKLLEKERYQRKEKKIGGEKCLKGQGKEKSWGWYFIDVFPVWNV